MTSIEQLLEKIISFQSITGDFDKSEKLLDWVEEQIKDYFIVKRFCINKFPSLIATIKKTKTPKLFLAAHLDVVPAPNEMFRLKIKGDKLIGRGVFDMNFALACYLQFIKDLKSDIKKYDFGLMLTTDEEIGGFNGTKALVDKGFNSKIVFLPDGGENLNIQYAAKGVWHLMAEIKGKTAHGSRPWEGREPFTELFIFLSELKKMFPSEPCGDEKHYHNSINVGKIIGGEAVNQVASSVKAHIDMRFVSEMDRNRVLKKIQTLNIKCPQLKIETITQGQTYKVDLSRTEITLWQKLARDMFDIKIDQAFSHGSSDARFFDMKKTLTLITRPKGGGIHSDDEWVSRKSLSDFYVLLKKWTEIVAS